jgi:chemotaxis protein MotB
VRKVSGMSIEERPEGNFIVIENSILFESGEIELSDPARQTLSNTVVGYLQDRLREHPEQQIRIDGHTDGEPISASGWKSNYHLAAMRAHSVMAYLASQGIPTSNMYIVGFGPNSPRVEPPEPTAPVAENRRVEILVAPRRAEGIEERLQEFLQ